jgi:hypothetical protein
VAWPPKPGDLLPRAGEPLGVRRKLVDYSLDPGHGHGWSKANGFSLILGITIENVDYLEAAICTGILNNVISGVRDNLPYGVNCVVEFPLRGVGGYRARVVDLRTVWLLADAVSRPRLLSAIQ